MKLLYPIKNYKKFSFSATITPRSPNSGFSLSFGNSGESGFETGTIFYGRSGLIFDQENNFFGGYYSGRQFNIEGHFFGDRLSYFYNEVLMNNNIQVQNEFDCIEFDKLNDSQLRIKLSYFSGENNETVINDGIVDNSGIFLISSDNFYILPTL